MAIALCRAIAVFTEGGIKKSLPHQMGVILI